MKILRTTKRYTATRLYNNLWAYHLTPELHERTCDYWYTVTQGATPHTAFTTRAGLDRWMAERGLELTEDISNEGDGCRIAGAYRYSMHIMPVDEFMALPGEQTRAMSNGQYTLAIIDVDTDGLRHVHILNPNVKDRPVFDFAESHKMYK